MKSCIINFAKGEKYILGQHRLKDNLKFVNFEGDFLGFNNEIEINAPLHTESPYAFKVKAFQYAMNMGYQHILWCDSSVFPIKPVNCIFDYIETHGHIFYWDGWNCAQWTNDRMLNYFNLTRNNAINIPQIYACFMGLNLKNKQSLIFLEEWEKAIPYFAGNWNNTYKTESKDDICLGHRHDQSAASILAYSLGMYDNSRYANKWLEINNIASKEDTIFLANGF